MKIDKTQINGTQFMFAIACFVQSSALLTAFLATVTRQDSWMIAFSSFGLAVLVFWVFSSLIKKFPEKNLLEIMEQVFGKVIGKILGVFYLWFFLTLTSLNLTDFSDFTKLTLLNKTPIIIIIVVCLLICGWVVKFGIKAVTRYGFMFVIFSSIVLAISVLLALNQFDFSNFLPMFVQPPMAYVQGTHITLTIPLCEIVGFLMFAPNIKVKKGLFKYFFWGLAIGSTTLLIVKIRDIGFLGDLYHIFSSPSLIVYRLANLGEALSRMEILFAIVLILLLFFKIAILLYISVITLAHLFKAKKFWHLILVVALFVAIQSLSISPNPIEHSLNAREITPIVWSIFEIIIPIILLVVAKLKKPSQNKSNKAVEVTE